MHRISLILGCIAVISGCVPTASGEFNTRGKPTSNGAEKLELITGVPARAIRSVSFSQRFKQYNILYHPKWITKAELSAAEQRMCRYRKLTYDRSGDDAPVKVTYTGARPPNANQFEELHQRSFYCR
jgi:hypothetical protein